MTEMSNGERFDGYTRPDGGRRFRDRQRMALSFGQIIKQLEPEGPQRTDHLDVLLDAIDEGGISAVAEAARVRFHSLDEPFIPANESDVRSYLQWLETRPAIEVRDIGSIDSDLIVQLRLTQYGYIDQLRDLIGFLDIDDRNEVSVLEFPNILRQMDDLEQSALRKSLIYTVLETHGISYVYDIDDPKAWSELGELVEDLARPHMRYYSHSLRTRAEVRGNRTPIRDVYAAITERHAIRERAFNLAQDNIDTSEVERRRMYEPLPEYMIKLVQMFIEDLEAARKTEE
jgi:hypothetical protein